MSLETTNAPLSIEALEVKELRALFDRAFEIRSTPAFFQLICENITPLLLSHPNLEECRQEWMTEKEQYQSRFIQHRKQAEREVKNTFAELKDRCPVSSPQYPLLLPLFRQIEEILSHKQPYFCSPYYIIVYHLLKEACSTLFTENHSALIRDWIRVEWSENLGMNFIKEFLFCPSAVEVMKLQEVWDWDRPSPMWVIWEYLYTACWAWRTPAKYFARKSIDGEGPTQSRHNMELIELHTVWCKMQAIRKGSPEKEMLSLFTVDRFSGYLQRIVEQILTSQRGDPSNEASPLYSLKLSLKMDI